MRSVLMAAQLSLFDPPAEPEADLPPGLRYADDVIPAEEAAALVARFAALPFQAFDFHGFKGNRRVVSFGWRYDFSRSLALPTEPIPDFLLPLRKRAAGFAGLPAHALEQVLVTEYAPGAGIGWHRDRPEFDKVVALSFLQPCIVRLRRREGAGWRRTRFEARPNSAYLLDGGARRDWQHSIAPMTALRYSVTFRSLR